MEVPCLSTTAYIRQSSNFAFPSWQPCDNYRSAIYERIIDCLRYKHTWCCNITCKSTNCEFDTESMKSNQAVAGTPFELERITPKYWLTKEPATVRLLVQKALHMILEKNSAMPISAHSSPVVPAVLLCNFHLFICRYPSIRRLTSSFLSYHLRHLKEHYADRREELCPVLL